MCGRAAAKLFNSGLQSPLELKIIVRIEDVVFAIVLILMHDLDFSEPRAEQADLLTCAAIAVECVSAPVAKNFCQIAFRVPVSGVDERQQAGAVGAGLGAEHPKRCAPSGFAPSCALLYKCFAITQP